MRFLASIIAAASVLAFTPSAALAGETGWLNTQNGPVPDWSSGYVRAGVTVEWLSKKTYDIKGWVEDVCPKDGNGGYVYLNNSYPAIASDANGCGNGRSFFDPAPVKSGYYVPGITVRLCERDINGSGHNTNYCTSYSFKNWR